MRKAQIARKNVDGMLLSNIQNWGNVARFSCWNESRCASEELNRRGRHPFHANYTIGEKQIEQGDVLIHERDLGPAVIAP